MQSRRRRVPNTNSQDIVQPNQQQIASNPDILQPEQFFDVELNTNSSISNSSAPQVQVLEHKAVKIPPESQDTSLTRSKQKQITQLEPDRFFDIEVTKSNQLDKSEQPMFFDVKKSPVAQQNPTVYQNPPNFNFPQQILPQTHVAAVQPQQTKSQSNPDSFFDEPINDAQFLMPQIIKPPKQNIQTTHLPPKQPDLFVPTAHNQCDIRQEESSSFFSIIAEPPREPPATALFIPIPQTGQNVIKMPPKPPAQHSRSQSNDIDQILAEAEALCETAPVLKNAAQQKQNLFVPGQPMGFSKQAYEAADDFFDDYLRFPLTVNSSAADLSQYLINKLRQCDGLLKQIILVVLWKLGDENALDQLIQSLDSPIQQGDQREVTYQAHRLLKTGQISALKLLASQHELFDLELFLVQLEDFENRGVSDSAAEIFGKVLRRYGCGELQCLIQSDAQGYEDHSAVLSFLLCSMRNGYEAAHQLMLFHVLRLLQNGKLLQAQLALLCFGYQPEPVNVHHLLLMRHKLTLNSCYNPIQFMFFARGAKIGQLELKLAEMIEFALSKTVRRSFVSCLRPDTIGFSLPLLFYKQLTAKERGERAAEYLDVVLGRLKALIQIVPRLPQFSALALLHSVPSKNQKLRHEEQQQVDYLQYLMTTQQKSDCGFTFYQMMNPYDAQNLQAYADLGKSLLQYKNQLGAQGRGGVEPEDPSILVKLVVEGIKKEEPKETGIVQKLAGVVGFGKFFK